jgi:hypothetical protein
MIIISMKKANALEFNPARSKVRTSSSNSMPTVSSNKSELSVSKLDILYDAPIVY